jgi:hypothetical protein
MDGWTFLLQKDGDLAWLPLDTPDVEILEGRYRMVLHTDQPDTEMSLRVCHLAMEADPPKRRIQKRSQRTNSNGLVVVLPYTHLQPGSWELVCYAADTLSDLIGDTQRHGVRLQVAAVAEEAEADQDWAGPETTGQIAAESLSMAVHQEGLSHLAEADLQQPALVYPLPLPTAHGAEDVPSTQDLAALNVEIAQALGLSMDNLLQMTEHLSHQLLEEVFQGFQLPAIANLAVASELAPDAFLAESALAESALAEPGAESSVAVAHSPDATTEPVTPAPVLCTQLDAGLLHIGLAQEVLVVASGETVTLSGQLEIDAFAASLANLTGLTDAPIPQLSSEPVPDVEGETPLLRATAQELQVCLRDPQTSEVLLRDRRSLAAAPLPFAFAFAFNLPADLNTRLVIGEISLVGMVLGEQELVPLKSQSFTITVDPASLLKEFEQVNAVLANYGDHDDLADLADQLCVAFLKAKKRHALDFSFLNLTALAPTPESEAASAIKPVKTMAHRAMPPQLSAAHAEANSELPTEQRPGCAVMAEAPPKKRLELPVFLVKTAGHPLLQTKHFQTAQAGSAGAVALQEPEQVVSQPSIAQPSIAQPPMGTGHGADRWDDLAGLVSAMPVTAEAAGNAAIAPAHSTATAVLTATGLTAAPSTAERTPDDAATGSGPGGNGQKPPGQKPPAPKPSSPEQAEFRGLRLQDRFLDRLNSLAADSELVDLLRSLLPPEPQPADEAEPAIPAEHEVPPEAAAEPTLTEEGVEEVVADDDPEWQAWNLRRPGRHPRSVASASHSTSASVDALSENPFRLPADQPVPMPTLEILTQEIVAGQLVSVRVKLPNLTPKIYVKLWVNDKQTRSLLDGPRWLIDFMPNGFGELEAMTQFTAPLGSLDIRIEAIAVEMQTQRESQKVGCDRSIAPPTILEEDLFADLYL